MTRVKGQRSGLKETFHGLKNIKLVQIQHHDVRQGEGHESKGRRSGLKETFCGLNKITACSYNIMRSGKVSGKSQRSKV